MTIQEKAENLYRALIDEKMISIRENHQKEMDRIFNLYQIPMQINGREKLIEVSGTHRIQLHKKQSLSYGEAVINACLESFIETYSELNEPPSEDHISAFRKELDDIADSFIRWFPSDYYSSIYSPIPSKVLVSRITQGLEAELRTIPGKLWPRINKFVRLASIRKERGVSINTQAINSIVARDIYGLQIGTETSTQTIALPQPQTKKTD